MQNKGTVSADVVSISISPEISVMLDDYIKNNLTIPIALFQRTTIEDAITSAIDYLKEKKEGVIEIPANGTQSSLKIKATRDSVGEVNINFISTLHRYPTTENRPYTNEDWRVGDIVLSSDISSTKCIGWVCIESGTPGKWTAFGWSRNWMSQCEIVRSLPDPSPLQEGRSVIIRDGDTGKSLLHYCIKNEKGEYEWVKQYFTEEDVNKKIEELISHASISDADTVDGKHAKDFAEAVHTHDTNEINGFNDHKHTVADITDFSDKITQVQIANAKNTVFNPDNSITETDLLGNVTNTVFNSDGSITETFTNSEGQLLTTKTTTFNADGSISEVVE